MLGGRGAPPRGAPRGAPRGRGAPPPMSRPGPPPQPRQEAPAPQAYADDGYSYVSDSHRLVDGISTVIYVYAAVPFAHLFSA